MLAHRSLVAGAAVASAAALALAGCGGSDEAAPAPPAPTEPAFPAPTDSSGPAVSAGAPAPGGGLSIDDALASTLDEPLLVTGFLVRTATETRLCSALAESFPPQCGGSSLVVDGLDEATLPDGLTREGDVTWSETPVSLLGAVDDGTITVEPSALG